MSHPPALNLDRNRINADLMSKENPDARD